jgi:hypothetical protein
MQFRSGVFDHFKRIRHVTVNQLKIIMPLTTTQAQIWAYYWFDERAAIGPN